MQKPNLSIKHIGLTIIALFLIINPLDFSKAFSKSQSKTSEEFIKLPFKISRTFVLEKFENELIDLVNEERKKAGLNILVPDPELRTTARDHSYDMLIKGYFSHKNLDGKTPFDRLKQAGINYSAAAENIAFAQTVKMVHQGLMNSPGHRANILNPKLGRIGIGIMDAGEYGMMVTQNFRN